MRIFAFSRVGDTLKLGLKKVASLSEYQVTNSSHVSLRLYFSYTKPGFYTHHEGSFRLQFRLEPLRVRA